MGDATRLPFADDQFDAVIMIEVLRYLHRSDGDRALNEARRVLKPGGTILVTLVNRWSLDGFWLFHRVQHLRSPYNVKHPYCLFFTPGEAARMFREAGFKGVETSGLVFGPIRTAYKLSSKIGAAVARLLERADDKLSPHMTPVAGHLIVTAQK